MIADIIGWIIVLALALAVLYFALKGRSHTSYYRRSPTHIHVEGGCAWAVFFALLWAVVSAVAAIVMVLS